MDTTTCDVIVIGGASAGLSAALMLGRARRDVIVVDAGSPRNRFAPHMHGVLGRDATSPLQLVTDGRAEIARYGGRVLEATVTALEHGSEGFVARLDDGSTIAARRAIVATGLTDDLPAIPGLAEQWGTGAVACPYCDGWESRDGRIGILASSPFDQHLAQLLRQWSADITVFTDGIEVDGDSRRALDARGIRVEDRGIVRVRGAAGALEGIEVDGGDLVGLDRIFLAPRPMPNDDFVDADRDGGWLVTGPQGLTSVPGLWAVGNVAVPYANVPVAIAAGTMAGAMANADLVQEEIAGALAAHA